MQSIHTYTPETNHVSTAYSVAAILRVLLMVHITLSSVFNSLVIIIFIITVESQVHISKRLTNSINKHVHIYL
jgi:hypothetical protein